MAFKEGDKVILFTIGGFSSNPTGIKVHTIHKIYKTGKLVLCKGGRQYQSSGKAVGQWEKDYICHYTDELWEKSVKPFRVGNKKVEAIRLIEGIDCEEVIDRVLKSLK